MDIRGLIVFMMIQDDIDMPEEIENCDNYEQA